MDKIKFILLCYQCAHWKSGQCVMVCPLLKIVILLMWICLRVNWTSICFNFIIFAYFNRYNLLKAQRPFLLILFNFHFVFHIYTVHCTVHTLLLLSFALLLANKKEKLKMKCKQTKMRIVFKWLEAKSFIAFVDYFILFYQ